MFITKSFELLRSAELTVVLECWLRWGFGYEGFDPASLFPLSQDKDEGVQRIKEPGEGRVK